MPMLSSLSKIVSSYNGIMVDYDSKGLLILDRTGSHILHLHHNNMCYKDVENVHKFFSEIEHSSKKHYELELMESPSSLDLIVLLEVFETPLYINLLLKTILMLCQNHIVTLRIYFGERQVCWKDTLFYLFSNLRETCDQNKLFIGLCGTFEKMTNDDKDFLSSYNVILNYEISHGNYSPESARAVIHDIADAGFRIPVIWYIHDENISSILDEVDDWMFVNYNSGFSTPLFTSRICYASNASVLRLPPIEKYQKLLIEIYRRYPFYDQTMFPLLSYHTKSLRRLDRDNNLASSISFIVSTKGFSLYNEISCKTVFWKKFEDMIISDGHSFVKQAIRFISNIRKKQLYAPCPSCIWESFCGGSFTHECDEIIRYNCQLMKFFIKVFLWQRYRMNDIVNT